VARAVRRLIGVFAVVLAAFISASPAFATVTEGAPAQALGRIPADFSRLDVGWLVIDYHPSLAVSARRLSEVGAESRQELQALLGEPVLGKVTTRLGRTAGEMELLAPPGARLPKYAAGVAFSEQGLILLTDSPRHPGEQHDLGQAFRHELAHVALHEAVGRERIPRWFNEGFAVHTSGEAETARIQALWTATVADTLIPLARLGDSFPAGDTEASVAYAQSADLVRFLLKGDQEHRFTDLLQRLQAGQSFEHAISDAYGTTTFALERDWRRDLAKRYTFWPVLFGGSLVWVLGLALLIWGYVKRKQRARQKMLVWAREEAAEDARRELALAVLRQAGPVRVVLGPAADGAAPVAQILAAVPAQPVRPGPTDSGATGEAGPLPSRSNFTVPKIEHDGGWHTLH